MSLTNENVEQFQNNSTSDPVTRLVPRDVLELLGDPPLIRGEKPKDYDRLFNQLAATIDPQDFVEWIFTKDILDLVWEIRRWRCVKSVFFDSELVRSGSRLVGELLEDEAGGYLFDAESKAKQLVVGSNGGDPESFRKLNQLLVTNGLNHQAVLSHALVLKLNDIERLEKLIASAEKRRDDLLKSIDTRRQTLAKRLKEASDTLIDELEVEETGTRAVQ